MDLTISTVNLIQRSFLPCICIMSVASGVVSTYTIEAVLNGGFYKDRFVTHNQFTWI